MKKLGKLVLSLLGGLLLYWLLYSADISQASKLGWVLLLLVLWINYEVGTAKDRVAELEWRIEELEREKSR